MHSYAKVLITNTKGELLCLLRAANHPLHPLHPDLPGGEVENGESSLEAVIREVKEETNLSIPSKKLQLVYSKQTSIPQRNILYVCNYDVKDSDIKLSWEHDSFKWVSADWFLNVEIQGKIDDYYLTLKEYLRTSL